MAYAMPGGGEVSTKWHVTPFFRFFVILFSSYRMYRQTETTGMVGTMKRKLKKILLKWLMILAGVLLIASAVEFMIWCKGPEIVEQLMRQISWVDAEAAEHGDELFMKALGFDKFFIPSWWPFQERYYRE
jgi:hypothetical protein